MIFSLEKYGVALCSGLKDIFDLGSHCSGYEQLYVLEYNAV
jgi:hypothetical protein